MPESFEVRWDRETLTFAKLTTPVLVFEEKDASVSVFARPGGMNVQIVVDATGKGTWTLSGPAGQASGSVTIR